MQSLLESKAGAAKEQAAMRTFSAGQKVALLLGNALSLFQAAALAVIAWQLWGRPAECAGAMLAAIYLAPPVLCRLLLWVWPVRGTRIAPGSRDFFVWWYALNLQGLFNRFPFLEEALRLVPGLYSLWLRIWGSRIGRLTYWAAGVRVLDRSFLRIGHHVTFGAGVCLNPHVMLEEQGMQVLALAPVVIGDHVSIGGYSLLTAGTVIEAGQTTRAFLIMPPFSRLEQGRRVKEAGTPPEEGT